MSICWVYCVTRYRAAIGPPIIYSPTHELAVRLKVHFVIGGVFKLTLASTPKRCETILVVPEQTPPVEG